MFKRSASSYVLSELLVNLLDFNKDERNEPTVDDDVAVLLDDDVFVLL